MTRWSPTPSARTISTDKGDLMKSKYDWTALRTEFVTGDMTAAALAEKHGIGTTTVYRRIRAERWEDLRQEYRDCTMEKCSEPAQVKLAREIDIADKLLGVLNEAINDKKQFYRYIVKEKNGADSGEEERVFGKMDMQAFNNAIKALDSLQEIKRVMHGILTPAEERKLQLAEGKGVDSGGEENETGVVILPEVEDEK